jgi:hypothetical protein
VIKSPTDNMLREKLGKANEQMRNMSSEFQTKLRSIESDRRNENRQMTADVRQLLVFYEIF